MMPRLRERLTKADPANRLAPPKPGPSLLGLCAKAAQDQVDPREQ